MQHKTKSGEEDEEKGKNVVTNKAAMSLNYKQDE